MKFEARRKSVWVDAKITEIRVPFDPRPLKYSRRIRKGQGSQILLFADNWNEEISEAIRCFVFPTEYFIPVFLMGQTLTFDE